MTKKGFKYPKKKCNICGKEFGVISRHMCMSHSVVEQPSIPESMPEQEKEPVTSERKISDIESEIFGRREDKIPPQIPTEETVKGEPETEPTKKLRIIKIKNIFSLANTKLNKHFNTNDFSMTDEELQNLEECVIDTLEYYKLSPSPAYALILCLSIAYGIPLLKHLGIGKSHLKEILSMSEVVNISEKK